MSPRTHCFGPARATRDQLSASFGRDRDKQGETFLIDMACADSRVSVSNEVLVLLRLRTNDDAGATCSALGARYKLTAAEERSLRGLAAGHSTTEIAEMHDVSITTVRKQVTSAMEKMGCHRQVDLVLMALGRQV